MDIKEIKRLVKLMIDNDLTEMNIVEVYGTGEFKDAWGREMLFDAASATS